MEKSECQSLLEKYQSVLLDSGMGFWQWNIDANTVNWDEGTRQIYDLPPGVYNGSPEYFTANIHSEDLPKMQTLNDIVQEEGAEFDVTYRIKTSKGITKYIQSKGHRFDNPMTKEKSVIGLNWNVTQEFLIQKERNDSNAQARLLATLINSSSDLFGYTDISGVPIYVNRAGKEIYGVDVASKKYFGHYVTPKEGKLLSETVVPKLMAEGQWEGEVQLLNPKTGIQNPTWVKLFEVRTSPKERFFACMATNLRELKEYQKSLIEQSKMASLGEMAGEIAHEINNPLMIIRGKAQLLKEFIENRTEFEGREKVIHDLKKIETNSTRIDRIIQSLQRITRKSTDDPFEKIPILKLLDEVFEISKDRFQKFNFDFSIEIDEDIDYSNQVSARGTEIVQVLVNLLNNSFDAVKNKKQAWVKVLLSNREKDYLIEVVDSGDSIPPHVSEKMFDPFFTTKPSGQGTGLGLSLSQEIIKAHQGILVYDGKHPNTRFYFTLPKK